jgi:hypothetical protein
MSRRYTLACTALVFGLAFGASIAHADTITTYDLNKAQCSGSGCGEPTGFNFGSVTVDINAAGTSATITYNLTTGLFHEHTGGGSLTTAVFDMTGVTSWSETSASSGTWTPTTSPNADGLGSFTQGENCNSSSGNTCGTNLVLTVLGTNLATAVNGSGFFGGVDILNVVQLSSTACSAAGGSYSGGNCTITGMVGTSLAQTPLPAALPLFAGGLGALGLFGWRRKRKTRSVLPA